MNELDTVTELSQYIDPLTRLKLERARKKEIKKSLKATTKKLGNKRLAKVLVKEAIRRIEAKKNA